MRKLNLNGCMISIGLTRIKKCTQKCKKKLIWRCVLFLNIQQQQ